MKQRSSINGFGKKLASYRKAKGLTQKELGEKVGVSNRVIAYYECETDYPPSHLIVPLAQALGVSTDELLGTKEPKEDKRTLDLKIARSLKKIEGLPQSEKKTLLKTIDILLKAAQK